MSDVSANVPELRMFARNLSFAANQLVEEFQTLKRQGQAIDASWRDQKNREFMEIFLPQTDHIMKLAEYMAQYSTYISNQADKLQIYLDSKM
ncbi:MAG: hypothetical protein MJZ84_00255 [Paludibacteraceae bacterium]|nr:hypothetical protein [Paludibacteraceae bacterium]